MSATDELRRLLDERDVEHDDKAVGTSRFTEWDKDENYEVGAVYVEYADGCALRIHDYTPEQAVAATLGSEINGETSDGYHTFNELYHHRAVLFSVIVAHNRGMAWKSRKHHDGTMYDGMFIVGLDTPWGQACYHYDIDPYWDMFDCMELVYAPIWDGHTPDEAIERIGKLATWGRGTCRNIAPDYLDFLCSRCGFVHYHSDENDTGDGNDWAFCPKCGREVDHGRVDG